MSKDIKEFKINRKNWGSSARFLRLNDSMLKESYSGKKCCLGFLATACGIPVKAITDICFLSSSLISEENTRKIPDFIFDRFDDKFTVEKKLADINDDIELTRKEKEEQITKIFADNGVKVTFTG